MKAETIRSEKRCCHWESPIGMLAIAENGTGISDVFLCGHDIPADFLEETTPLLRDAVRQLTEYFAGKRKEFDLPLSLWNTVSVF